MRAVLQGLDPSDSWRRYLAVADARVDLRLVKATLQWIRDEFAAAAQREQRPGTARLVQLDARRTLLDAPALPSLEDFVADAGLDEFSQDEQLQAYLQRYGAQATRQRRSQRLLDRQLAALRWLETLAARAPRPTDPVHHWLHPLLADKLAAQGLDTLEVLLTHIQTQGHRWHRHVAGIGTGKADRIVQWLRMQEVALSQSVGAHVDQRPRSWAPAQRNRIVPSGLGVLPLEKLALPPDLSGVKGSNRAPIGRCQIPAGDDLQALHCWLGPATPSPAAQLAPQTPASTPARPRHTYRAYRKEAERLLLWAVLERHKPLSSLDSNDARAYLHFLSQPQPPARWCSRQKYERWSPDWRPFNGPLSPVSVAHAARVLRALFRFLADQGYVQTPLFDTLPAELATTARSRDTAPKRRLAIALPLSPEALPPDRHLALRLSVCAAALPRLRLRQLCEARLCDLAPDPANPSCWRLQLPPRQGRKPPPVTLPAHIVGLLPAQRPGLPLHPDWPLFAQGQRGARRITALRNAPPRGIQPGTLGDQLRAWHRQRALGQQPGLGAASLAP